MALTPEQIDRLIRQAGGLPPKEGGIYRALVKLTEAEVRKEYTELIRQMRDALSDFDYDKRILAIAAANARLENT